MILPSKHISEAESLLAAGALLLDKLDRAQTVTELWEAVRGDVVGTFDRFVLAAQMLHAIGVVSYSDGFLVKSPR